MLSNSVHLPGVPIILCGIYPNCFTYFEEERPPINKANLKFTLAPNIYIYSAIYTASSLLAVNIIAKIPYGS